METKVFQIILKVTTFETEMEFTHSIHPTIFTQYSTAQKIQDELNNILMEELGYTRMENGEWDEPNREGDNLRYKGLDLYYTPSWEIKSYTII